MSLILFEPKFTKFIFVTHYLYYTIIIAVRCIQICYSFECEKYRDIYSMCVPCQMLRTNLSNISELIGNTFERIFHVLKLINCFKQLLFKIHRQSHSLLDAVLRQCVHENSSRCIVTCEHEPWIFKLDSLGNERFLRKNKTFKIHAFHSVPFQTVARRFSTGSRSRKSRFR